MERTLAVFVALTLVAAFSALADGTADPVAGKAKSDQMCATCHGPADWKGRSQAELQGKISDVVAGKVPHNKKLQLSQQEIADIAAYWASVGSATPAGK